MLVVTLQIGHKAQLTLLKDDGSEHTEKFSF
jgi:hypothetical protein